LYVFQTHGARPSLFLPALWLGRPCFTLRLPGLSNDGNLPVVLLSEELRRLFFAAQRLKHRVLLTLIYSAGMRVGEVCNLKISDIDSDRMQGVYGLNRPSTKALGAKRKCQSSNLTRTNSTEMKKQMRLKEAIKGSIRATNDNPSQENPRVTY
jgi:integrase